MKMLYTANGRYIRCCTEEGIRPVIIVCDKEYEVDVQEFMLWSILNWRILREEEIGSYYEKMASNTNVTIHRSWQDCVQRLLVRGLIVAGTSDTEYDALYDLLACRFIIPIGAAWPLRVLSFLKLTFLEGISWKMTRRLFHVDARSSCEKKVIRLARQTPLSCAEIIKCIEMDIRRLKDGYDVLDNLTVYLHEIEEREGISILGQINDALIDDDSPAPGGGFGNPFNDPNWEQHITSFFGKRKDVGIPGKDTTNHNGLDIAYPYGTPILAVEAGTVIKAGYHVSYGNYLVINHGGGYCTLYAHCSQLLAQVGDTVNKYDTIAKVGATGDVTGNHLHICVIVDGVYVNPKGYLH